MPCISIKYAVGKHKKVSNFLYSYKLRYLSTKKNVFTNEKEVTGVILQEAYNPKEVDSQWYEFWESRNYFNPKEETEPFAILLPPPNVTGTLHLGHALTLTIQDVLLRWKRMKGESVMWIPGIDHAGIATQTIVEKHLSRTLGLSRHDIGREEFLLKVKEWKNEKGDYIIQQLKNMGATLDWNKLIYTMDSNHSQLVTNSFISLYNDGLIYRKKDLINWSCALKSSISDIEVDYIEIKKRTKVSVPGYEKPVDFGVLYEFAYKICDEDEEIVVSSTRPETMLGDVAIAVHPESPAHARFINKQAWHPFRNEKIPIVGDQIVDASFGTGAVKITPAHSLADYEVALRHNLKPIEVINEEGLINKVGINEKLHGLKRFDARKAVIDELSLLGLFRGYKTHYMKIPVCSRSGDVIEYMPKSQWFLKCSSLAEKAAEAVESGELRLEPKSYSNIWDDWLKTKSVSDWNLSRQLWWGHQIPMYKCRFKENEVWLPSSSLEEAKLKAADMLKASVDEVEIRQDPDVLDTWFSSALLPLNPVFGKGKKPPISLLVTGHDILFFWVVRMVMLSIHFTGALPFSNVFLHSLVCDANGKKMSKSLGNVVSPEDIIKGISLAEMKRKLENDLSVGQISQKDFRNALTLQQKMFPNGIPECGVDGLRFTLCSNNLRSSFVNFDTYLCRSSRFFCNKIYQAVRYFIKITDKYKEMHSEFDLAELGLEKEKLNCFDRWILSRLAEVVISVDKSFSSYAFTIGTSAIRLFLIENFCNTYLESSKVILKENSPLQYRTTVSVFFHCMETSLRLLSPLMPFLSEHLYQALPPLKGFDKCESVTSAEFPTAADWSTFRDVHLENQFGKILNLLRALRKAKEVLHLKTEPNVFVRCPDEVAKILFGDMFHVFRELTKVGDMTRVDDLQRANILRQMVEEDCTALVEHPYDKATLEKLLGPNINKESDLKESLQKLQSDLNTFESKKSTSYEHQRNKINALKLELDKIKEFKYAIDSCSQ